MMGFKDWSISEDAKTTKVLDPDEVKLNGDSEACRSAFRSDVDHDSEMKPISIPI